MSSNEFEKAINCLNWNEDPDRQNEAIDILVNSGDRLDLSLILQKGNKACWQNEARVLLMLGYPRFREVIPAMLEWLQDLNWPGSEEIVKALASVPEDDLAGFISQAAERALLEGDAEWLEGLRHLVHEVKLAARLIVNDQTRAALFDRQTN